MTPPDTGRAAELKDTLFDAIAHGDETHRAWLKEAIACHFAGRPVPPPVMRRAGEAAQKEGGEVASAQTLPHPAPTSSMKVPKDFGGTITLGELREMIGHFYNSDRGKTAFNSLRGLLDYIEAIKPTNEMGGESRGEARQSRAEIIEEAAEEYRRAAIACREEGLNELADHFDGKYRALVGKPQRSNVGTPLI